MSTSFAQIRTFLQAIDEAKAGRLLGGRDLDAYSEKILKHAEIVSYSHDGALAGLIAVYCNRPEGETAFIAMLAVSESHRRTHIGTTLLQAAISTARAHRLRRIRLQVREDNPAAIAFYRKAGFEFVEVEASMHEMELLL